jgi:tetratricopeptide (TPR) repeat protein
MTRRVDFGGSIPLLYGLSLIAECQQRVEQALLVLKSGVQANPRREMHLRTALQATLVYTDGPSITSREEWEHILAMATELGDIDYQARAVWGLWNNLTYRGFLSLSLTFANRVAELAARRGTSAQAILGDRTIGISLHYGGDQVAARTHLEHVLSHYDRNADVWRPHGSRIDHAIVTKANLARVLWIQGYPDRARCLTGQALHEAIADDFPLPILYVLAEAATAIPLFAGDFGSARRSVEMLRDHAQRNGFRIWQIHGRCFEAMLDAMTGPRGAGLGAGLTRFVDALRDLRETGYCVHLMMFLGALAELQGATGQTPEGLRTVDEALQWCESHGDQWYIAELLRVGSELLVLRADDAQAAVHLRAALDWSRRQGAVSWELRAATSFARLLRNQGRPADATACLQPIYDRFTEGFGTADLIAAKQLLDDLGGA